MDLIYTDAARIDMGVLTAYSFDLSFGAEENNFEITLGLDEPMLDYKAFVYIENTEYGGIVDRKKTTTNNEYITYIGRTWHGIMNSKIIQPDSGADYLKVSGEANSVLGSLIERLGLGGLFAANPDASSVVISNYQFKRYCKGYDGIRDMLADNSAKLKIEWKDRVVYLSAEPIIDYTESPVDDDMAVLTVEHCENKVNHLICLGRGELAAREVIHLYADAKGNIGDAQHFFGLDEICETYDYSNAESLDDLRSYGKTEFRKLRDNDTAEMDMQESIDLVYDIGDLVGATDIQTGNSAEAPVSQKIVRINNGAISIEYQTGG